MCCGPTETTTTSRASLSSGIDTATVSAVSVLPFQATAIVSPRCAPIAFGTIIIGRPLSNSASSSVASAIEASFFRLFDEDQIEHPAAHPDDGVLPAILLAPGGTRTIVARRRRPDRHALPGHEIAEQAARLIAPLVTFALKGAIDLGGNRKAHLAAEDDGILGRQAVQPDDMAVEPAAAISAASRTDPALPSPITASRFFMAPALLRRVCTIAARTFYRMIQDCTPVAIAPHIPR